MLRNALEHKFVSVHMFSTENEVKIGKDYIYRISEDNLIECTMDLLQLIIAIFNNTAESTLTFEKK